MTYSDEEAGAPAPEGDGHGQGDLNSGRREQREVRPGDVEPDEVPLDEVPPGEVWDDEVWDGEVWDEVKPDEVPPDEVSPDEVPAGDGLGGHGAQAASPAAFAKVGTWFERKARLLAQPEPLVTLAVVAVCVGFVLWQFEPSKLFLNTTISGGDTGAHVLLPWVTEHDCLAHFRLTCWTSSN